jgi:hypothetical protein
MVTKKASGKPTSTKRRAAKSAGNATDPDSVKRPPQEPIIVGGGSVYIEFDKKFKVGDHPNRSEKRKADHEDFKNVRLIRVLIYDKNGRRTNEIALDAKGMVKVCYTGANRP